MTMMASPGLTIRDARTAPLGVCRITPRQRPPRCRNGIVGARQDEINAGVPATLREIASNQTHAGRLHCDPAPLGQSPIRRTPMPSFPANRSFERSSELQARLHDLIPGGAHAYSRGSDQYPQHMTPVLVRGHGCRVWDADDNEYIEYGMGLRAVTSVTASGRSSRRCARLFPTERTSLGRPCLSWPRPKISSAWYRAPTW